MSRIFEALQHAEKERLQREKSADKIRAEPQRKFGLEGAKWAHRVNTADLPHSCLQFVSRVRREGLKDFLYRLIGLYPWRCNRCLHRLYRFQRSP